MPWPANTCLLCVGKEESGKMGAEVTPVQQFANPGEEVDVSTTLRAPMKPGRYVGYYRLAGGSKVKKFGQRVRIQIIVF